MVTRPAKTVKRWVRYLRVETVEAPDAFSRSRERYRRAGLSGVTGIAARGIQIVTSLVTVPLTLHYLGAERYGMWMAMSSLVAMLGFADLGIGNGLLNAISDAHGREDRGDAARYVSSAFFSLIGISLVALVTFGIVYAFVPWAKVFNVTTPLAVAESGPAVAVLMLGFVLGMPLGVISRVRAGYQEAFIDSVWIAAGNLLGLALVLLSVAAHVGLPWLVLAMSAGPLMATALNGAELFWRRSPWLRPRWSGASRAAAYAVLGTGVYFFVLQIAGAVAFQSDSLVIAQVVGPAAVAQYAIPMKLFMLAPTVIGFLLAPLWPAYAEAVSRGDTTWAVVAFRRSVRMALLAGTATSIVLLLVGKPLIRLWVGSSIQPSTGLLVAAGVWAVLTCISAAYAVFLNGVGVLRLQVVLAVLMMIANLALSIAFTIRIGVSGVIWGSVVAQAAFVLLPLTVYLARSFPRLDSGQPG